jgi:hypothetical protein
MPSFLPETWKSIIALGQSYFGNLDRITGSIFVTALAAYLVYAYRQEKVPAVAVGGHTSTSSEPQCPSSARDRELR